MSNKPSAARMRAKEIISDFKNGEGSFAPRTSSTATAPSRRTGGGSADDARQRMVERQAEHKIYKSGNSHLAEISRAR